METNYLFPMLLARGKGGGGMPSDVKYATNLSLTIDSSTFVVTAQLIDQNGDDLGTTQTIDLPLESVVVGGSYNDQTKKVVLTLQNGNTVEFSVADLVAGLQTELSASNKLNPEFINYDSTHRAVSDAEKTAWNGKQSALTTTQLSAVNSGINGDKVSQIATNTAGISTLQPQADWNTNHGVKNMAPETTFTATLRKTLTIAGELSGKVTLSMSNITSTDTDDTRCRILFEYKDGGSGGDVFCKRNIPYKQNFDIGTHVLARITIYASDNYAHSSGDTLTVTELMVKPTTIGDDTYQPYAMSNAELTENEAIDRAALVEIVDKGAKNHIDAPSGSGTRWKDISCNLPAGEWVLSFDELSTTWEAPTNNSIQIGFYSESYALVTDGYTYIDLDTKVLKVKTLDTAKIIRIYASPTSVTGKTVTYRNAMICTKAAWDISEQYVPNKPYITVNDTRIYVGTTQPTDARVGDLWIGG